MKVMAFVGKNEPTKDQIKLASEIGYRLVPIGEWPPFNVNGVVWLAKKLKGVKGVEAINVEHPEHVFDVLWETSDTPRFVHVVVFTPSGKSMYVHNVKCGTFLSTCDIYGEDNYREEE